MSDLTAAPLPAVIVGAGPAGLSAAAWLQSYEVPFHWLCRDGEIGGLLRRVHNTIDNVPPHFFENGRALVDALETFARERELVRVGFEVQSLEHDEGRWLVHGPHTLPASAVILATGTRYRTLGVPGEAEGLGRHVSQSATKDGENHAGETVAVVGGGDAALENALRLAEHGCEVHLLARSELKARPTFVEAAQDNPRIELHDIPSVVRAITETRNGCRLELEGNEQLEVSCLFVRIGVEPVVPAIVGGVATDARGFVVVDELGHTDRPGLFAAGDVTATSLRSVVTAMGAGATAARTVAGQLRHL